MTDQVPEAGRQLAGRLAEAFEQDRTLAEQLNDCQDRSQPLRSPQTQSEIRPARRPLTANP